MGFMDEVAGGGGAKLLKFDGKAGNYVVRGSEGSFNNQEFVADVFGAKGSYLKFGGKDQPPERQLGSIFPKDEAPLRSALGNLDKSDGRPGGSAVSRKTPGLRLSKFRSGTRKAANFICSPRHPRRRLARRRISWELVTACRRDSSRLLS
jgi:hypothetical protein